MSFVKQENTFKTDGIEIYHSFKAKGQRKDYMATILCHNTKLT